MFAQPPSTFWHEAACSLAEPSPGFTAKIVLPTPILPLLMPPNFSAAALYTASNSGSAATGSAFSSIAFCAFCTSLARPTYAGSFLDSVNSASPSGLDLYDDVSPEGISSSVVVTGSWISDTTLRKRFSGRGLIFGQSLILGPNLISTSGSALPWLSNTLFSYISLSKKYFGVLISMSRSVADVR